MSMYSRRCFLSLGSTLTNAYLRQGKFREKRPVTVRARNEYPKVPFIGLFRNAEGNAK